MYYVYIIESESNRAYYKGFSEQPLVRLAQHNSGECSSTQKGIPWKLVFIQLFESKREALIREKVIKKYSRNYIKWMIDSNLNELKKFLELNFS